METIVKFMADSHQACDEDFARAEGCALNKDWAAAVPAFQKFLDAMMLHFRMEEEILFPALQAAGGPAGPVQIMLMEHAQMQDLFEQMKDALTKQDAQGYGGIAETLLIVMQQHNHKEEQILYPIADHILAAQRESLLGSLRAL